MERRQQNPISNDRRGRLWRSMSTAGSASAGSGTREAPAKAMVMEQISQAVQSSANLLHLMQNSSPAQVLSRSPSQTQIRRDDNNVTIIINSISCIKFHLFFFFLFSVNCFVLFYALIFG